MTNPDVWQEKLVALLYGELSPEDEREVRLRLESDAELRREWDELQEGRSWMTALETEVEVPSFVFLHDAREEAVPQAVPAVVAAPVAAVKRWWNFSSPVWAAAAAVFLVAMLGVADFRIARVDGGLAFTFGDRPQETETLGDPGNLATQRGTDFASGGADQVQLTPVSGNVNGQTNQNVQGSPQIGSDELLYMVGAMLEDRDRRRDQQMAAILQAMYDDMDARQERDYQDLRNRIQAMNAGFALEREGYDRRFNSLEGVQSLDIQSGDPVDGQKEN